MKKEPQRMCIICKKMFPKNQLIRFVVRGKFLIIDDTYKLNGKGFYICKCKDCILNAAKHNIIEKITKTKVSSDFYNRLKGKIVE